jgi:hypothetical protein
MDAQAVARARSAPEPSDSVAAPEDATGALLAALAGFTAIAVNLALLLAVRRGLPVERWLIALLVAYASLVICCATAIEIFLAGALRRAVAQLLALVALLVLPIVFFGAAHWLLALLAVVTAWTGAARARRMRLRAQPGVLVPLVIALVATVGLSLYGVAGFQHDELQNHFLMPEYGRLGLLHKDPLLFVSFAAEIMNGRWPGAALDGLRPIFYHFGAPLFLASFARTAGSSPFHAYMAGQQLLFIPLILFYSGLAASSLARCAGAPVRACALSVALAVAAVLVVLPLRWGVVYYSEASGASAPLAFMMLPLAAAWLSSGPERTLPIAPVFAVAAAILAASLFKFSTGMTAATLAGYLILRRFLPQRASDAAALIALALGLALAVALWPVLFGHDFVIAPWQFPRPFRRVAGEAAWALSGLAIAWALQRACRSWGCELERTRALWRALLILFPFAAAGACLIATVHHLYDGRYLFNNVLLLALPLIAVNGAALLHAALLALERRGSAHAAAALPAMGLLLVLAAALGLQAGRAAPSHAAATIGAAKQKICERAVPEAACRAAVPRAFGAASAEFVAAVERGVGPRILAVLGRSPAGDAFFVPPGNEGYWIFALGGMRSFENLNFLPAHFGKPMLLGLPPAAYGVDAALISGAMLDRYGDGARSRAVSDRDLCGHARARAIDRVVVFASLEPPGAIRLLDCRV